MKAWSETILNYLELEQNESPLCVQKCKILKNVHPLFSKFWKENCCRWFLFRETAMPQLMHYLPRPLGAI